jgi:hypothetical protein
MTGSFHIPPSSLFTSHRTAFESVFKWEIHKISVENFCLFNRNIDWLVGWYLCWLIDWLIDWFVVCFLHSSTAVVGLGLLKLRFLNHVQLDTQQSVGLIWTRDKRQASMPPAGFEPAIPAIDRSQALALSGLLKNIISTWYRVVVKQFLVVE